MCTDTQIQAIANALALHSEQWTIEDNGYQSFTLHGPGTEETLHVSDSKGRLRISCGLNGLRKFLPYRAETPSITVDNARPPATIAKEITRRLLPDYRAVLAQCITRRDEHNAANARKRENLQSLVNASGNTARLLEFASNDENLVIVNANTPPNIGFSGRIYTEDIHFERMDLPLELAIKLMQLIASANETQKGN